MVTATTGVVPLTKRFPNFGVCRVQTPPIGVPNINQQPDIGLREYREVKSTISPAILAELEKEGLLVPCNTFI